MTALAARFLVSSVLLAAPPVRLPQSAETVEAPVQIVAPKAGLSRRLFIASGIVMGIAGLGEMAGAIIASQCSVGSACTVGFTYAWGSPNVDTRYSLVSTGPGSAYVLSRVASIPLIWTGEGLLLAGTYARTLFDVAGGHARPPSRSVAWGLLGTGLGLYLASRIMRLGFALGGVCQDQRCVYAFDQTTLGVSRGLAFPGSALVLRRRTLQRVSLGVAPMASFGMMVTGRF